MPKKFDEDIAESLYTDVTYGIELAINSSCNGCINIWHSMLSSLHQLLKLLHGVPASHIAHELLNMYCSPFSKCYTDTVILANAVAHVTQCAWLNQATEPEY